jgi:SAM-dependent methyltransferase
MAEENPKNVENAAVVAAGEGASAMMEVPPEAAVHDRIMDAYYGKMGEDFMRKTQERVHWVCASTRGNRILDVGCSQGIVPILLGREGKHVVGVDTDIDAIAVAEAHLAAGPPHVANYVRFVNADFMGYDFGEELFDTVIMSEVLEHLVDPRAFLRRAVELLNEAGALVVTLPFGINDFIDHKRTYYLVEAFELISRYFEVQEVELFGKWIGFRCGRTAGPIDTVAVPTIPLEVLRATEKAFYALERSLTENLKKARQQLAITSERVKDATKKLSDASGSRSIAEAKAVELGSRLSSLETRYSAAVEEGKQAAHEHVEHVRKLSQELQLGKAELHTAVARLSLADETLKQEREAAAQEIGKLKGDLEKERATLLAKLHLAEGTLEQEREAAAQEIGKLQGDLEKERGTLLAKLHLAEGTLEQEREAAAKEIGKLQGDLENERGTLLAKLHLAEGTLEQEREAAANEIGKLQGDLEKERATLLAKLHLAERTVKEEREGAAQELLKLQGDLEKERHALLAKLRVAEGRLEQEREGAAQEFRKLQDDLERERNIAVAKLRAAEDGLEQERVAAAQELRTLQDSLTSERNALAARLRSAEERVEQERQTAARELSNRQKMLVESRKGRAEVAQMQQKLQKTYSTLAHYKSRLTDEYAQLQFLRTTVAFQLGSILTFAFRSPVHFFKTPVRLARLTKAALFRGATGRPTAVFVPDIPSANGVESSPIAAPVGQVQALAPVSSKASATNQPGSPLPESVLTAKSVDAEWQGMSALGWPDCTPGDKPVAMAVMDEFTTGCFENDLALVLPRPDNWRSLAEKHKPELFFIESAWKGNGGSWQYRIAEYANRPGEEIADMALYASDHNIPMVFWNKEDPVHHQKFMVTAKMADHIFTTDANMLDSYREKTGNQSVHALPFAAQPALHFPAVLDGRRDQSCFAGSWYGDRHEKRGESMQWLLRAANRHGMVIYDRNHGSGNFTFPEEYHAAIKGGLPYKELCAEYRRYRVFLNVNSVTDSPTMFSRRVFELMACGTPVVSTFARGIDELFESNAVWLVDSEEQAEEAIRTLLSDDAEWRRRSLAGIRDVFANHTYAHRLNQVFGQIGLTTRLPVDPKVLLLALAASEDEVGLLVDIARIQSYPSLSLRIGAPVNETRRMQLGTTEVTIVPTAQLIAPDLDVGAGAMGWISSQAAYGPGYVRDLANAMTYRPEAHGWGKALDDDAFAFGQRSQLQASVWRPEQFQTHLQPGALARHLSNDHLFIADRAEYAPEGVRVQILEK